MGTAFFGEGNIGTEPEYKLFPASGNKAPKGVLKLNVMFNNLVPTTSGFVDKGGFWAIVEIWHTDVEMWSRLYQKGMRVMVRGRIIRDTWNDRETGDERFEFKVYADSVGVLPHRLGAIVMNDHGQNTPPTEPNNKQPDNFNAPNYPKSPGAEGEWDNPSEGSFD